MKDLAFGRAPYALTFADSVARFGASLIEDDLHEAYRRAGTGFNGQLRQLFVVLKEDPGNKRVIPARAAHGTGSDRGAGRGRGARGG